MITLVQLPFNQPGLAFSTNVMIAILGLFTLGYGVLSWRNPTASWLKIGSRLTFLWGMTAVFVLAILYSPKILICYLWFIAFLALKEFFSITPTRRTDRRILFYAYLAVPIQFIFILLGWRQAFQLFMPIHVFLVQEPGARPLDLSASGLDFAGYRVLEAGKVEQGLMGI